MRDPALAAPGSGIPLAGGRGRRDGGLATAGSTWRWRWRWDLNPRWACTHTRFRGVLLRPLGHATGPSLPEAATRLEKLSQQG